MIIQQTKDCIKNPLFHKWNITSLSHLFIASTGANGPEARELGTTLLKSYLDWAEHHTPPGMGSFFGPPMADYARQLVDYSCKVQAQFTEEGLTTEQIKDRVYHGTLPEGYPEEPKFNGTAYRAPPEWSWKSGYEGWKLWFQSWFSLDAWRQWYDGYGEIKLDLTRAAVPIVAEPAAEPSAEPTAALAAVPFNLWPEDHQPSGRANISPGDIESLMGAVNGSEFII